LPPASDLPPAPAIASEIGRLFAAAAEQAGGGDPTGAARDLAALLARLRTLDPVEAALAVAIARERVARSPLATAVLDATEALSDATPTGLPFGPVAPDAPGAAERIAIATLVAFRGTTDVPFLRNAIDGVVEAARGDALAALGFGAEVQAALGGVTPAGFRWRDTAASRLLRLGRDHPSVVQAATGGALPNDWRGALAWITPWVARQSLRPSFSAEDGLFVGAVPATLHPLALVAVEPRLREKLDGDPSDRDEALAFCRFLSDRGLAAEALTPSSDLLPPAASPGVVLSAGSLMLRLAEEAGVVLGETGAPEPEAPEPFAGFSARALRAVALGFEPGLQVRPAGWETPAAESLLAGSPDWSGRFAGPLADLCRTRAAVALRDLAAGFAQLLEILPSDVLRADVDGLAATPLAGGPAASEIAVMLRLAELTPAIRTAAADLEVRRGRAVATTTGPLGARAMLALAPGEDGGLGASDLGHGPVGVFLAERLAALPPALLLEAFAPAGPWARLANRPVAGLREAAEGWSDMACWDALRGRSTRPGMTSPADALADRLPPWLKGDAPPPPLIDPASLRPALSALALLGPGAREASDTLRNRLQALLDPGVALPPDMRNLLAAARVELAVTTLAANAAASDAGEFRSVAELRSFAEACGMALRSGVAWDARAGVNGFVLLSRLAASSADPVLAAVIEEALPLELSDLVALSTARALEGPPDAAPIDSLPLAFAAASLLRYARERSQALSTPNPPGWVVSKHLPAALQGDADALVAALTAGLPNRARAPQGFALSGSLAWTALLLVLHDIAVQQFSVRRRTSVEPLRAGDRALRGLRTLEVAGRERLCAERLLLDGLAPDVASPAWWSVRYWSGAGARATSSPATPPSRDVPLLDWALTGTGDTRRLQLLAAAGLAAQRPQVRAADPSDLDGRTEFSFPTLALDAARSDLETAIIRLRGAEDLHARAIEAQTAQLAAAEIVGLLRAPLRLSIADAAEQVAAADAEVRRADADLEASLHDLAATQFEQAASDLLYEASRVEIEMQAVRVEIARLQGEMAELDRQAAEIDVTIASAGETIAQKMVRKAQLLQAAARIRVDQASRTRAIVRQRIALLELLLVTPVEVEVDGQPRRVRGLIARMGVQIASHLASRLEDDLEEARRDLDAALAVEARRRRLERSRGFISGILGLAGAIVGVVLGGPAGAAFGAAIGGAVGDLVGGIVTDQPLEQLLVGVAHDAFSAAKAGGVNLDGLMADLGAAADEDADRLFETLETTLRPALATLPTVLDGPLLERAFRDLEGLGGEGLAAPVLASLRSSNPVPPELVGIVRDAALRDPIALTSGAGFRDQLADRLAGELDRADDAVLATLGRLAGIGETPDIGRLAQRLAALVATRTGLAAQRYRTDALKAWIGAQQRAGRHWEQVAAAGEQLIAVLVPEAAARGDVLANVRLTLMDPKTFQAEVQTLLEPWQRELDRRIDEVRAAGEAALGAAPAGPVGAAQARVDYLERSQDRFFAEPGGLLVFLHGESAERAQLETRLQERRREDELAEGEAAIQDLALEGAAEDVGIAGQVLAQATANVERARTTLEKHHLVVEAGAWQNRLNALAGVKAETLAQAQAQARRAAAERVRASEARVAAARASLAAREAHALAARARASEAARIRQALARPPLRLPADLAIQGTMALAGARHEAALERGLAASRQLMRLVRLVRRDAGVQALPPPDPGGREAARWSDALQAHADRIEDILRTSAPRPTTAEAFPLSERQIAAVLSERGLDLVFRPGILAASQPEQLARNIDLDDARNGRVAAILVSGRSVDGAALPDDAFRPSCEYQGDHWVSATDLRFIEVQGLSAARVSMMPPDADPEDFVIHQGALQAFGGDGAFARAPGTPVSGTTRLRLRPLNPRPIASLDVTVLYHTIVPL